ncbi:ABC transporter ATP-binding protein [Phytomonospora endophytica]|uniref:ABC-2 type transport system ATP-binding protein n=1 Tax=Phytomonospora endophytica TaxID=714109 RepID=A0A841FSW6_9ACTN|nr:ATP-binding cassette domain-containing protein [Phytomonospora endophytica]MBB6035070.1 ABC-2 type transport system ATP-binding protein [Phytomonospora endophytica]GIG64183.1 multidrug ABC transporter ATP-binding protein [Phytomonospora endophytica]
MIEVDALTKRYGDKLAVHDLSFTVRPGQVTGFLGPNGAGKSTTMRMIVGLDRPTSGRATVNGIPYAAHPAPLRQAGALLEAKSVHKGRSARAHLVALAQTHGLPASRADELLDLVGLSSVAHKRAGTFSLGMSQRLGVAAALVGDPGTILLDEPVNGLDPDGVLWIRTLLKDLAAEGCTVLVSSHLMSEMAVTAEHLVIIGRGRLLADTTVDELIARVVVDTVVVRTSRTPALRDLLTGAGATVETDEDGRLLVGGLPAERIGELAATAGLPLYEVVPQRASLEQAYMELTRDTVEYEGGRS